MKRDITGKFVRNWNSEKKQRVSISLTSTAWRLLDEEAKKRGISRSEVIEHVARSLRNEQDRNFREIENIQLIAAQETERKVATILESITDAFVAFDHNWHYTYVNQAAAKILSKTPEELIGKHVWNEVFPEVVGGVAYQALHRAVEQQVPVSWEEFGVAISRWLEVNAYPSAEGVSVYFRDVTECKQAEAERERLLYELETEHTRFEAVLQQLPVGVFIADAASGKLVLANEQAKHIFGYGYEQSLEIEEYAPIIPYTIMHPDGQEYSPCEYPLMRSLRTGEVVVNEEIELQNDNRHAYITVNSAPILNSQNQIVASVAVFQDITERKQADQEREQLLERERIARMQAETAQRQLATIFETSPVGMALLDKEQRFVAINEALAQINGLSREQHLGHSLSDLFGQSTPRLVEVFNEVYTTGNCFSSPSFAVSVPGRSDRSPGYYNVYYLPIIKSNHQVENVLAYVLDVTDQVWLERGQRFLSEASTVLASSLDYQTTLERVAQLAVPELADWCTVHIVKDDGSIEQIAVAHTDPAKLQWVDQIRQKYPLNPNAPRGAGWTLRTGKSDLLPDISDELLVQAARDPEHLEILRSVGFKSVMTVPLRVQAKIIGVITFVSAESGQRYDQRNLQLAEELAYRASLAIDNAQLYHTAQSARAKAEAANRVKDEFLAVLSHELRSPLNPILGWTRLLRNKRIDLTKANQALEIIERNTKLQAQLIEDLLDVSRILRGKMSLNVASVNLTEAIEAALETVRLAAEAKNIQIQTIFNPVRGTVSGDINRIQQIVWNFLSNAVKFTPSGGQVEVQLEQVGMYAHIQVKDTGIGISPEFLPYVFEYFRQQDGATTRKFGGLGLGLAIVRHLTELHGGTVQAESLGQNLGATFTVKLPLNIVEQELSSEQSHLENEELDLKGVHILVVDDDPDMCELAEVILTQAGAHVTTVASALQALTLLNQSVPDLLLSDIGMPEMDGYSMMRQIRQYSPEQGGTIPAIALSAYAGEINQQQALQAGFQQHIAKPINPDDLVKAIAQLLRNVKQIIHKK